MSVIEVNVIEALKYLRLAMAPGCSWKSQDLNLMKCGFRLIVESVPAEEIDELAKRIRGLQLDLNDGDDLLNKFLRPQHFENVCTEAGRRRAVKTERVEPAGGSLCS